MAYDALRTIMPIAGWPEERAHEVEISVGANPVLPRVQVRSIWVDRCVTEQGGVERTCVGHGVPSDLVVDFKTMFDTRRLVDRRQTLNPGQSRYPAGACCAPNAGRTVRT